MGRTFCIGDVHGTWKELIEMLQLWNLQPTDTVVFLGDLIHKAESPQDSINILYIAHTLQLTCNVVFVAGNHEEKQLRWQKAESRRLTDGTPNMLQHTEGFAQIRNGLTDELFCFMLNARLYYQAEGFLCLHGGLPSAHNLPPDITLHDLFTMKSSDRDFYKQILWCRYVDPRGRPVALGSEKEEDRNWAEAYDGRLGTILFGHQPFLEDKVRRFPHAIGLDLGCVFGNYLAAVQISNGQIVDEFYIKAHKQYCPKYYQE